MRVASRGTASVALALVAALGLAACGDSKDNKSTATPSGGSTETTVAVTPASFTNDISAMAQLKSLAAQGKGKIAVLLPDTSPSARYESFDRPYLTKAFQAAGLTAADFKIDNAQGSAATMQTQ